MTEQPIKILIADDERPITEGLSALLADEGYAIDIAVDGQKALEKLSTESYGVVLADLKMPKLDGTALLREIKQRDIPTECIIISGQGTITSAVDLVTNSGAFSFVEKPLTTEKVAQLKGLIRRGLDSYRLKQTNAALASQLEALTHYGEITGQSEAMQEVYKTIDAVAPSTASVLILGESGTGKELVARAIHTKSDRAKGPFFALNCAALPKDILENELFGHEKGAFTGSTNEKPGAFEMTDGGTLFLDEVAEMATDIQVKLLRALESRTVRRLGGKKEISVDIRVVAATNKDLQKALADGELREDLYYRLAVVELYLPPLRERGGDIRLLASEFLHRFSQQNGKKLTSFDDAAMDWILAYHWPGNVRELKNAVERAVIMSRTPTITFEDVVPRHLRTGPDLTTAVAVPVGSTLAETRRQLVLRSFAATNGDLDRTAKMVGMTAPEVRGEMLAMLERRSSETPREDGRADARPEARQDPRGASAAAKEKPAKAPAKGNGKVKGRR
jgi:DNA-binding NtrC family response regulator